MPDAQTPDRPADDGNRDQPDAKPAIPRARGGRLLIAGIVVALLLGVILVVGTLQRISHAHQLRRTADDHAIPDVSVVHPVVPGGQTLVLPARLAAWSQAPIYAQVSGYLRRWNYDIGAHVAAGAVLGEIATPEVDQQLSAARAGLDTAKAQQSLAATTSRRFSALAAQNAVSQQQADTSRGDYAARQSMRDQAQADVGRLQALIGFRQLVAPFAGVVTARNTDVGSLIAVGQAGGTPLFTVSDLSRLRLYVSIPQAEAARIVTGLTAQFTVPDYPGRTFAATVARSAGAIDPQSGAMLVQLVYDNAAGLLKPGAYAEVTFDLPAPVRTDGGPAVIRVPSSALLFRSGGPAIATVAADGTVHIHHVGILTDLGTQLQVTGDLTTADWVIDSPPDAVGNNDKVHATPVKPNRHG